MSRDARQIERLVESLFRLARGRISFSGAVLLAVLLVAYLFAEPLLERKLGVDLPGLSGAEVAEAGGPQQHERPDPQTTGSSPQNDSEAPEQYLQDRGADQFESPAGLLYKPGSFHGHRIKHVLAHAKDQPGRQGSHGVFEVDPPQEVFRIIDEAYLLAKKGERTEADREDGRVVYTVDLGRKIGYIGGQSGARRNNPPARHLRLVLEGRRVITAYPVRP